MMNIAVDRNRCHGIERISTDEETKDTDVILLDDAYQHRYVKPGINILLVDYHRLIIYDKLLPAGRLREPKEGKTRALSQFNFPFPIHLSTHPFNDSIFIV